MTGAVIVLVAIAAIAYAAWYEAQLGRAERADRDFARRHKADVAPRPGPPPIRFQRDPSPRRRAS